MPRFTFKKQERLSSLKAIEELYQSGSSFNISGFRIVFRLVKEAQQAPCQVVFSVPKKSFKRAVDRNLIKRRMREAYRLNKNELYEHLMKRQVNMHLLFIYTAREISTSAEISQGMLKGLQNLIQKADN